MPVVLRAHGLRFVIFVDDHRPPHVHVRGAGEARIALDAAGSVLSNKGLSKSDIAKGRNAVKARLEELTAAWIEIHGSVE